MATTVVGWAPSAPAAESRPDAAKVRRAAESYDAGVRSWNAGRYAAAASHFEAADEAVPSAVSLGEAIKSRRKADHGARAATLAALAKQRHPSEASLLALADEVLAQFGPATHRLEVRCSTECVLAVGQRVIAGPPTRSAVLFVDPGQQTVSASFADGSDGASQVIVAHAGGHNSLYLRPAGEAAPAGVA
ncbi:MAG: hypothetical protein JRI23_26705, partial [Deltaproteobacteria bacterium]|nr:hypothetical protein [Deltaproteobacteria bacterium]